MWYKIVQILDWFGDMADRYKLIRDFNTAAKNAFIGGFADTLLEARITMGESSYRHTFSKFMGGGFRIKALSGRPMARFELIEVGQIILDNEMLIRKLISLGWDTLEVNDKFGAIGCKWPLKDFAHIGGFLPEKL